LGSYLKVVHENDLPNSSLRTAVARSRASGGNRSKARRVVLFDSLGKNNLNS
jgi:hypothetical protein